MIVNPRYFPQDKHSEKHELKPNETYTEDLSIFLQPLELIDEFFALIIKADECPQYAFVGKALVEQCAKRTNDYIEALSTMSGDIEFICAKEENKASIPGGTLLKIERKEELNQPTCGGKLS